MNLMASPTDKSLKFLTATVQSVLKWKQYENMVTSIYEVFGENFTSFTGLDFSLSFFYSVIMHEYLNLLLTERYTNPLNSTN